MHVEVVDRWGYGWMDLWAPGRMDEAVRAERERIESAGSSI